MANEFQEETLRAQAWVIASDMRKHPVPGKRTPTAEEVYDMLKTELESLGWKIIPSLNFEALRQPAPDTKNQ